MAVSDLVAALATHGRDSAPAAAAVCGALLRIEAAHSPPGAHLLRFVDEDGEDTGLLAALAGALRAHAGCQLVEVAVCTLLVEAAWFDGRGGRRRPWQLLVSHQPSWPRCSDTPSLRRRVDAAVAVLQATRGGAATGALATPAASILCEAGDPYDVIADACMFRDPRWLADALASARLQASSISPAKRRHLAHALFLKDEHERIPTSQARRAACLRVLVRQGLLDTPFASDLLLKAVCGGMRVDAVRLLLDAGADPGASFACITCLHGCLNVGTARLLVGAGADVNAQSINAKRHCSGACNRPICGHGSASRWRLRSWTPVPMRHWQTKTATRLGPCGKGTRGCEASTTASRRGWCAARHGTGATCCWLRAGGRAMWRQ